MAISNADGQTSIQSPIAGKLLNKDAWTKVLSETSNKYIIYSAVDNTLAQPDHFSQGMSCHSRKWVNILALQDLLAS